MSMKYDDPRDPYQAQKDQARRHAREALVLAVLLSVAFGVGLVVTDMIVRSMR